MDALPYYKWHWQRWRANRRVQRMSCLEKGIYRELLDECWAEGSIPDDEDVLADIAGCTKQELAGAWQVLSMCFYEVAPGRLTNHTLEEQRTEQDSLRAKRKVAGAAGGKQKIANAKQVLASAKQVPYRRGEKTREEESKEEKSSSASPSEKSVGVSKPKKTPDDRHTPFRDAFEKYFSHKNPGAEASWDAQEATQLSRFLRKQPNFTLEQWKFLLTNRARSPVAHGDNLSAWLGRAMNWASGPTDGFGKPISTGGSKNGTVAPTAKETYVTTALQQTLDRRRDARRASGAEVGTGRVIEAGEPRALPAGDGTPSGSLFGTSAADRLSQI